MSPLLLFSFVILYFLLLLVVAWYTGRNSNNESFFIGNKNSNWMLVAFGMIGTSLSGVTFVSVPGAVGDVAGNSFKGFAYMQVAIGYLIGYVVIAYVLLPLYYRLNLTSIYNYLQQRFGNVAYRTGALFFIISRTVGATARLYLVINVIQFFILDKMGVPFVVTAAVILLMILLYTFEGGVKTIVYTDTLQTSLMIAGLIICVVYILSHLNLSVGESLSQMKSVGYLNVFNTDVNSKGFFLKQIIGGAFITIAMTGLDQEMMQKNISVKRLGDSQKNVITLAIVLVCVLFLFLLLGGLLYLYATSQGGVYQDVMVNGKAVKQLVLDNNNIIGDKMFPSVVLNYFPPAVGIIFIIALISALFPSADGALTALTSSFCIDIIGLKERHDLDEKQKKKLRLTVHLSFTVVFLLCIMGFKVMNDNSIIDKILDLAGYTYGPLLGLFAFGIFTRKSLPNTLAITVICVLAPAISYFLSINAKDWFGGYQIGIELLIINGLITFLGLLAIAKPAPGEAKLTAV
ncbi:sodium:solute symporter [Sediminibacterium ginsengisoli]|uniref:Na+/proline symporter n=1 Tax=Sediminibacterium ginsengisoli TaxID=413434 RepID=A0A1T4KQT2_9BACT|nr:sodium:solute symporter [Sediminibacterium ginsengisoli]SJZ44743.1 Na+/proline symporter [Sediminibacterium ginsengisoli]